MNDTLAFFLSFVIGGVIAVWVGVLLGHYWVPSPEEAWWGFGALMTTLLLSMAFGIGSGIVTYNRLVRK